MRYGPLVLAALACVLWSCDGGTPPARTGNGAPALTAGFPGTRDGAMALLAEFLKPGADRAALTAELKPASNDYVGVFKGDAAARLEAALTPAWDLGAVVIAPQAQETQIALISAVTEDFQIGMGNAARFPEGYEALAPDLSPGVTLYCATFTAPGAEQGTTVDSLVYINGKWRLFPHAMSRAR